MVPGLYSGDHEISHCGCYYTSGEVTVDNDPFWQTWTYDEHGELCLIHDMPTPANVLADLIERMANATDAHPEALALMRMAAEAQRTGRMPDLSRLDRQRAGPQNPPAP